MSKVLIRVSTSAKAKDEKTLKKEIADFDKQLDALEKQVAEVKAAKAGSKKALEKLSSIKEEQKLVEKGIGKVYIWKNKSGVTKKVDNLVKAQKLSSIGATITEFNKKDRTKRILMLGFSRGKNQIGDLITLRGTVWMWKSAKLAREYGMKKYIYASSK